MSATHRVGNAAAHLDVLAAAQAHGRVSSMAAAVFDRSGVHWAGSVGENHDTDTQYRIGSITKTFTAVLVVQAVREGLLAWDTTVGSVVPELAAPHGYAGATIGELLGHTGGLQSEPVGPWWERHPGQDRTDLLRANDGSGRVGAAGEFHHYSNLGYALLGAVVEELHGADWMRLVQSRLLDPLGLSRTTRGPSAPAEQGWSIDHFTEIRTAEPGHDTGAMAPAGQLWSTVNDLARWGTFLVSGHPDIVDAATLASLRVHVAPGQGLGVQFTGPHQRHLVGHSGSMPGFKAALFVDPVTGDGAAVLCNATTGPAPAEIVEQLLGRRDPLPPRAAWAPTVELPAAVDGVPGLWFWGNTAIEVRWHAGGLDLHSLATHRHADRFELLDGALVGVWGYHRGETLRVSRDAEGTPVALDVATFRHTRTPEA